MEATDAAYCVSCHLVALEPGPCRAMGLISIKVHRTFRGLCSIDNASKFVGKCARHIEQDIPHFSGRQLLTARVASPSND